MEIWQPIRGFYLLYEVSNKGRVKSYAKNNRVGRILSQSTEKLKHTNYKQVTLVKNGKKYNRRLHRLVAEAFLENTENKPHVNHIDNNGENNDVSNLEWCTQRQKSIHATKQGRTKDATDKANSVQSEKALIARKEMVGKRYGKWTVLEDMPKEYTSKTISKMLCRCECGTQKEVDMINLKNGRSTQCKSCSAKETLRRRYASTIQKF